MEEVNILDQLAEAEQQGLAALATVSDEAGLQAWKTAHLAKSAPVMLAFTRLGGLPKEERAGSRAAGQPAKAGAGSRLCRTRRAGQAGCAAAGPGDRTAGCDPARAAAMPTDACTRPPRPCAMLYRVFGEMGFQVYRAPDVETDEHNFELLNIPAHHPARDMWDTFHTTDPGIILRTHTSPGQIRAMRERHPEPIRVILPGMVLPLRADQRHPRDPVQPGGAAGGGTRHHLWRPERHPERFRPAHVRPGCAHPPAPLLLPLHRTQRRDGCGMLRLRRQGLPRSAKAAAGWRLWAAA